MDNDRAFMLLNEFKDNVKTQRKREENMKFGFDLFKINYVPSPDLEYVEKEISSLEDVWNTKENWDNKYKEFCKLKFKDAKIEELDDEADDYTKKLTQYPKEMKKWEIVNFIKNNID